MLIAVLADTHIPKRAKTLSALAWSRIKQANLIIHAGDVLSQDFLDQLVNLAPVYAVRGNNDVALTLPEKLEFEIESVKFALIHDSGARTGRPQRLKKLFPTADVVIFGHSHVPVNEQIDNVLLFNPGSATDRRSQPQCTMGSIKIFAGKIDASIIRL